MADVIYFHTTGVYSYWAASPVLVLDAGYYCNVAWSSIFVCVGDDCEPPPKKNDNPLCSCLWRGGADAHWPKETYLMGYISAPLVE